jgi:parallel beta-helix repeat protein
MNPKWLLCTAIFASCATPSGEVQPATSDLQGQAVNAPTVALSVGRVTRPALVSISARVAANVSRVEFFQNGRSIGVDAQAPFAVQALFVKPEQTTHAFTVKAFTGSKAVSSKAAQLPVNIAGRVLYVAPDGAPSNDGLSEARALPTIQGAMNLTLPGDTVLVKNGTYSFKDEPNSDVVTISRSGNANAWIALMAYPGQKPKIESVNWNAIKIQASYIIVDGFTCQGNLDQLTLEYARSEQNNGSNPTTGGSGISVAPPYDQKLNRPHHVIVRNNTVFKFPGSGIGSGSADYLTIEDNLIYSTAYYSPYDTSGISLYQNWNSDGSTGTKMIVRRNIISDTQNKIPFLFSDPDPAKRVISDGNGIIIDDSRNTQFGSTNGKYVGRTLVENNISFNNGARGIHVFSSDHVDVLNNTTLNNSYQPETPDGEVTINEASDVRVFNNIIMPRADRKAVGRGSSNPADLPTQIVKRNLVFGGLTPDLDPNLNLTGDPKLIDPAKYNFRPANDSPAINAGDSSLSAKEDIERRPRPQGAGIDLGAYEIR